MRLEILGEALKDRCLASLGREDRPALVEVGEDRHVVLAATEARLVDPNPLDAREVLLAERLIDVELDEPAEIVLAIALNNLSLCLSHPSRRKERIAVIEETVEIYRRFTELDPNRWESRLAEALNNLGTALHAAGRPADALRASQESVRRFQDTNAPLPDLAGALSNHSTYLFLAGRHGEALKAIEHSVTAYEALIQSESDRYAPDHQRAANILSALLNGDSPFR